MGLQRDDDRGEWRERGEERREGSAGAGEELAAVDASYVEGLLLCFVGFCFGSS